MDGLGGSRYRIPAVVSGLRRLCVIASLLLILGGLVVLTFGADVLVRGASAVARRLGVSSLVIGLTVVAFGTSAPELAVSLKAGLSGTGAIALGNIVGSNIFNVAVILGIAAFLQPLAVERAIIRREFPILLVSSVVFAVFLLTRNELSRWEGGVLFAGIVAYCATAVRNAKREARERVRNDGPPTHPIASRIGLGLPIAMIAAGLGMLVLGSRLLVDGAVDLARILGVSEAVIGLTIVAAGTSMPELATSIVAAIRREADLSIGNVVGSNIFNILCIGGVTASATPLPSQSMNLVDLGTMLGLAVLILPIMWTGFRVSRPEGALLLATYGIFLWLRWPAGA